MLNINNSTIACHNYIFINLILQYIEYKIPVQLSLIGDVRLEASKVLSNNVYVQ